jgi:transcription antitermination factor NusG
MTPGVTRIVGLGKVPTPVNEAEMASMKTAVGSGLLSQPWPFLQAGDRVHIERGPLRGLEGILLEVRGEQRLVLSVTLLQRSVAVVIDPTFVRSLSETSFIPVRRPDSHSYNSSASSKKAIGILG